jgi:hypothetical protein
VLSDFVRSTGFKNQGERVVTGERLMQASSDIFLGWQRTLAPPRSRPRRRSGRDRGLSGFERPVRQRHRRLRRKLRRPERTRPLRARGCSADGPSHGGHRDLEDRHPHRVGGPRGPGRRGHRTRVTLRRVVRPVLGDLPRVRWSDSRDRSGQR